MDDLAPSAEVKAALIDLKPDIQVTSNGGPVPTETTLPKIQEENQLGRIDEIVKGIHGLGEIKIHTCPRAP